VCRALQASPFTGYAGQVGHTQSPSSTGPMSQSVQSESLSHASSSTVGSLGWSSEPGRGSGQSPTLHSQTPSSLRPHVRLDAEPSGHTRLMRICSSPHSSGAQASSAGGRSGLGSGGGCSEGTLAAGLGVSGCDPGSSSSATGSPPPSPTPSASSASAMGSSASPSSTLVSPTSDELPSLASSEKPVSDPLSPVSLPSSRVA